MPYLVARILQVAAKSTLPQSDELLSFS